MLGLGYVGLPTASMFAMQGHTVIGVDPSPRVHEALGAGRAHIQEPDLDMLVQAAVASGRLRVARRPEPADVFIVAVPTPLDERTRRADLSSVRQAAEDLLPHLRRGNLVILESTVPPGTTRDVLAPILAKSGLRPGQDLSVAHCPERVLPGRVLLELVQNDRLAGGLTATCAERAGQLYESFVEGTVLRTDATSAEMAKVMENTYRDVNIALANELALVAEQVGVDVWEVIRLANRHPRVNVLRPGPGVGGHCIAVDPWFLVQAAAEVTPLIQQARAVNDRMPQHVLRRLEQLTGPPPARLAVLGVTFKADVDDVRESPALRVAERAVERGYDVRLCDPHAAPGADALPAPLLPVEQALRDADAVVLLVDHAAFSNLDPHLAGALVARKRLLDTRGALDAQAWEAAGFEVARLGSARRVADLPAAEDTPGRAGARRS